MRISNIGLLAVVFATSPVFAADIYPWKWVDPAQTDDWVNGRTVDTSVPRLSVWPTSTDGLNLTRAWFRGYSTGGWRFFTNATLTNADFAQVNYPGTSGSNALSFLGANLSGASFINAQIPYAGFGVNGAPYQPATLTGARFDGANLSNGPFYGVHGAGASFTGATLQQSNFMSADLTNASFRNASLTNASFSGANVTGADFSRDAAAVGTGLTASQHQSTSNYTTKDFHGVSYGGLNLTAWGFYDLNLTGASFRNANLTAAGFSNAVIVGADFSRDPAALGSGLTYPQLLSTSSYSAKDLHGVSFDGLSLTSATLDNQNLTGASFRRATLSGSIFYDANLSGASFANADLSTAQLNGATIAEADFSRDASAVGSGLTASMFFSTKSAADRDVHGVRFDGMTMTSAEGWNFINQGLSSASFRNAQMNSISMYRAALDGAIFDGANLTNADLSSSGPGSPTARGASFRNANLQGTVFSGRDLTNAVFHGATVTGNTFSSANLTFADFRGAVGSMPTSSATVILADGTINGIGRLLMVPSPTPFKATIVPHAIPVAPTYVSVHSNNTLELQAGASLTTPGSVFIGDGGQIINNGNVTVGFTFVVQPGGLLSGSGTIMGNVRNDGAISPGNSPGLMTIDGDLTNTGTILLEIAGADVGRYDRLAIDGNLTPGGTIKLAFADGFVPAAGDEFDFISWTGQLGSGSFTFDTTEAVAPGLGFAPTWSAQGLSFVAAVPEPGIVAMAAGFGCMALLPRPRRRRR